MISIRYRKDGTKIEIGSTQHKALFATDYDLVRLEVCEGILRVVCRGNQIESLELPKSVYSFVGDTDIKGLEPYIGKVDIFLRW